jgi:hypothetical protein
MMAIIRANRRLAFGTSQRLQAFITQTHQDRFAAASVDPELAVTCGAETLSLTLLKEEGVGA